MPYIGNPAVVGDSANNFKLLDDIASYTLTFDGTSTSVVSVANDTLTFASHRFVNLQRVTYTDGGGTAIGGLTDDGVYYVIRVDTNTIKLATSSSNAASGTAINITGVGVGGAHTLKIAFDGINTKFKATHTNGISASISRAGQLQLSINGVIQQPQDTASPTLGFGVDVGSTIVFSTAPEATDRVFATFIGEVSPSFDITDNVINEFEGDGSTTTFNLSKEVTGSQDILVTLDGVVQYPNSQSATRAYSTSANSLIFTSAPADGVIIQARHIGFAGAVTPPGVTGFYGRSGNVTLKNTDNITVNDATVTGNLSVTGDIEYDEATARNLNVSGIATVGGGLQAIGIQSAGTNMAVGVLTALNFVGTGNTFLYNAGTKTVDISIAGGGGGAVGTGTDKVFYENDQTVTDDYTISAGKNAMSAGPVAIAANKSVIIPSGSEWTIV